MNRGFLYGDGFFETIKVLDGLPVFWKEHWLRILKTNQYLKTVLPFSEQDFKTAIKDKIDEQQSQDGRLRITFYREGAGKYLPLDHTLQYCMEFESSSNRQFELSKHKALIPSTVVLPAHDSGNYKLISKTLQIKAAIEVSEKGFDEAIMLNDRGEVAEGIAGNVFIIKKGKVLTPSLASGCLEGSVRAILLNHFSETSERKLKIEDLEHADAVFLTNSIRGIQIIEANEEGSVQLGKMVEKLNELMINSIQDF